MVLDECPKLTEDKKIISVQLIHLHIGQKDLKLLLENLKLKHLFGIVQGDYFKIYEKKA